MSIFSFKSNLIVLILCISYIYTIYVVTLLKTKNGLEERIQELESSLEKKQEINEERKKCEIDDPKPNTLTEPSTMYEKKRRKLRTTIQYLWEFIKKRVDEMKNLESIETKHFDDFLQTVYEHKISLLSDWKVMSTHDGYDEWRKEKSSELSTLVHKRFDFVMNPTNCTSAKYLKCPLEYGCGWGCQLFSRIACFSLAYGMERTLFLWKTRRTLYESDELEQYYEPISRTCNKIPNSLKQKQYPGNPNIFIFKSRKSKQMSGPFIKYLPLTVPNDLLPHLEKLFDNPDAWWTGQMVSFIVRLNRKTQKAIQHVADQIGFKNPIVGVHIRRGNKVRIAGSYPVEDYMSAVNGYYDQLELTQEIDKRRIFLATDDPEVLKQIQENYTNYEVLVNRNFSIVAQKYKEKNMSSFGVLTDAMLLSHCDYFVGTLSSHIGRRLMEFFHAKWYDASERIFSLDNRYWEFGQLAQKFRVIIAHTPRNEDELSAHVGDILEPINNSKLVLDQYGYMPMINTTSKEEGLIPSFKLERIYNTADIPNYNILK